MKKLVLVVLLGLVLIGGTTKKVAAEKDIENLNNALDVFDKTTALSFNFVRQENITFKNSDEQQVIVLKSGVTYKNLDDFSKFQYANGFNESSNLDFIESFNSSLDLYDNHKLFLDGVAQEQSIKSLDELNGNGLYILKFNSLDNYKMTLNNKGNESVYVFDVNELKELPVEYGDYFVVKDEYVLNEFTIIISDNKPKHIALIYSKEDEKQSSIVNISIDIAAYDDLVEVPFTKEWFKTHNIIKY